jgi:hypothetical protein
MLHRAVAHTTREVVFLRNLHCVLSYAEPGMLAACDSRGSRQRRRGMPFRVGPTGSRFNPRMGDNGEHETEHANLRALRERVLRAHGLDVRYGHNLHRLRDR